MVASSKCWPLACSMAGLKYIKWLTYFLRGAIMERHIGSFGDYASGLIRCLVKCNAPHEIIQSLQKENDSVFRSRMYTAPEAFNESREKFRYFQKFLELEKYYPIDDHTKDVVDDYLKKNG